LIRKLQQLTISFHTDYQSGKLHSKFIRDIESIEMMLKQGVGALLPAITAIVYVISVTASRQIYIALFFIMILPVVILIRKVFRKSIEAGNREYRKSMENLSARLSESIEMLPVARAHAVEHYEIEQMDKYFGNIRREGITVDTVNGKFGSISWVIIQFFGFACLIFSGYLASKKLIPIGDIVMYQTFFTMLTGSMSALMATYPIIAKGLDSIKSINEILNSPDIEYNRGKKTFKPIEGAFTFDNVSFYYDNNVKALENINFTVRQGQTVALVGGSGSGKTTLINLIIGFLRPADGHIFLDDQDCAEYDMRNLRKNLAVVSQNPVLFHGTIRENLTYGLMDVSDNIIIEALDDANALHFVHKMEKGIDTVIGEHGATLSGGQKQRLVIARAILRNPKILIFDEATSALDTESETLVQTAINAIVKGRTTFIVAHRFSTIRNADLVVFLDQGRIAEIGTIPELLKKDGKFARSAKQQGIV
jgi:ATP-binding cassette subfamily B protein